MRTAVQAPKRPVNLSITADTIDKAKALGMNLSKTVDALLGEEVNRRYWEKWNEDNQVAIDHYNARIDSEGLPLAKYRSF
ncbi:potential post-segregation antitoxin [Rhodoferax ferrireducens T118]|uniref:Potential post-segregation antitoxin n=1 Tax=Albidiferax ferrireducens (strain ATCC BAA-621 / DSM 15236 / T118) TaxID=338969 RepID=Q21U54_ALBFT|nr:type II toxin-antitoxin system CcdA family antitoxin [Rhodoferax ferrireducens]ABD70699.1 potential post-segregation antitoxin [Rhodoferax ferrireducens T118]